MHSLHLATNVNLFQVPAASWYNLGRVSLTLSTPLASWVRYPPNSCPRVIGVASCKKQTQFKSQNVVILLNSMVGLSPVFPQCFPSVSLSKNLNIQFKNVATIQAVHIIIVNSWNTEALGKQLINSTKQMVLDLNLLYGRSSQRGEDIGEE